MVCSKYSHKFHHLSYARDQISKNIFSHKSITQEWAQSSALPLQLSMHENTNKKCISCSTLQYNIIVFCSQDVY